jgi:elongation factor G
MVTLCVFLSNHTETRATPSEAMSHGLFRIDHFAPAIDIEIEAEGDAARSRLVGALSALASDHPNFNFAIDEFGKVVVGGIDELQLARLIDAAQQLLGSKIAASRAQVAYRERITRRAEIDYVHKKQVGGIGEFARVKLVLEPTPADYDCTVNASGARSKLHGDFISAVEQGVRDGTASGVPGGFPVIGMRVMPVDGAAHDSDSTPKAFEVAARAAIKDAVKQAQPQMLEPVLRVEITTPEKYVGPIIADLKERDGVLDERGRRSRSGITMSALVRAINLFGYADAFARMTETRGDFSVQFDRYAPVPSPDDPSFRPAVALRA